MARSLGELIANSVWSHRLDPFPHILVEQVFIPPVYDQLATAFRETRLVYYKEGFDGHLTQFKPSMTGPLSLFISKAWADLLAKATGVSATRDVNGALHCHAPGSKNGFIHKDFSSCWFIDRPRPDGINVADNSVCNYRTGETSREGAVPQERVRAVAMLFYLNNPPWSPGDGGETGLYRSVEDQVDQPAVAIPPINNSMLIFECSPHSNHSFITNRRNSRSSIVMWLHRTKEDTAARWGEDSIVYVKGSKATKEGYP